jgi:hypothetical protein
MEAMMKHFIPLPFLLFTLACVPGAHAETGWWQDSRLSIAGSASLNEFGNSVSLSEYRLVVGEHFFDDFGNYTGSAYVFEYDGRNWMQTAMLLASDVAANDWFGHSVVKLHAQLTHFH